ncbi:hypothetical protein LINGRAHAP2_LOCUS32400 [Linum grandiflorum]
MAGSSKELLNLEKDVSDFQTSLLVCGSGRNSTASQPKVSTSDEKLVTAPIPQSQVLGKVRDFLGVFSEANRQLQQDAKDNSQNYDIEALTGNESEVIEMDLMLGVAELRNEQALAAAESALAGGQPSLKLDGLSSESDSEDSSEDDGDDDDDDEEEEEEEDEEEQESGSDDDGSSSESDSEDSSDADDDDDDESGSDNGSDGVSLGNGDGSSRVVSKRRPKKQPKITELP